MKSSTKLGKEIQQRLICPVCKSKLKMVSDYFVCVSDKCSIKFPVVKGIPVLINEANSLFSISDFANQVQTYFRRRSRLEQLAKRILPSVGCNLKAKKNLEAFSDLVVKENSSSRVLIVGGGITGQGLAGILSRSDFEFVETDVVFGPRTSLICDAHDLPFADETFDGVIIQAVLEHVVDPYRCVDEIYRVLKSDGIVYAETAFIQHVHNGRYDFTRFTLLGHRRLFRRFEEICSGAEGGPAIALASAWIGFLLSFSSSTLGRALINVFTRLTLWWLKYFDYYLINQPGGLDSSFENYFMGRKNDKILSDTELIKGYRGAFT